MLIEERFNGPGSSPPRTCASSSHIVTLQVDPTPKDFLRVVKNCSGFDSDDPELTATAQHDSASHRSSAKPMVETQVSRSTAVAWHASHVFRATPEANRLTADVRR